MTRICPMDMPTKRHMQHTAHRGHIRGPYPWAISVGRIRGPYPWAIFRGPYRWAYRWSYPWARWQAINTASANLINHRVNSTTLGSHSGPHEPNVPRRRLVGRSIGLWWMVFLAALGMRAHLSDLLNFVFTGIKTELRYSKPYVA